MFIVFVTVVLQLPPLAANMTEVDYYFFSLMMNGTSYDETFVFLPVGTTMVDLFYIFPSSFHMNRNINYSLSISAVNSFGDGEFTESVSIGGLT